MLSFVIGQLIKYVFIGHGPTVLAFNLIFNFHTSLLFFGFRVLFEGIVEC